MVIFQDSSIVRGRDDCGVRDTFDLSNRYGIITTDADADSGRTLYLPTATSSSH